MSFESISVLNWLMVLAAAALGWIIVAYRRKSAPMGAGLSVIEILMRALILALLVMALARPYIERLANSLDALLLVDISDSMDEAVAQQLLDKARELEGSEIKIVARPFAAKTAAGTKALSDVGSFSSVRSNSFQLDVGQTNLEQALLSACNDGSAQGAILLISDGQETQGRSDNALAVLTGNETRLFPLVPDLGRQRPPGFRISQIYAPLLAPAQKSVAVRVTVENSTGGPQSGSLEVQHGGKVILTEKVEIPARSERVVIAQTDASSEGIQAVEAKLLPANTTLAPSSAATYVAGESREKVLVLNGSQEDARLLDRILQGQAYQVRSVVAAESIPSLPALEGFSAVVFNNISDRQLPAGTPAKVAEFVAQGGGFIMIGGNRSFGLGGYIGTPIEELLPVQLVPPQAEQKRLNAAVELVLDKSRSMADNEKLEYAKEAAREVVKKLKDDDFVGVIGFDEAPFELVKLGRLRDIRAHALERIGRLFPDKRTNLYPSMEEARRRLEAVEAGRKHMIVLTDGKLPDAGQAYFEMVKQMRFVGITVSTVMVGSEFDFGFLRAMAEYGGGAYYQTDNPSNLPRIFLQDVTVSVGERTLKEQSEFSVRRASGKLVSTSLDSFPPLRGYVETAPRPGANLELMVSDQNKGQPLLASWNFKKGRVLAFTSDANGRWSNYWAGWGRFSVFWSEMVDAVRPEKGGLEEPIRFDLRHSVERGVLEVDLSVFTEDVSGGVMATLMEPGGAERTVKFSEAAKGRYRAEIHPAQAGKYEFRGRIGERALTPVAFGVSGELFGEKKGQGFDVPLLERLAHASGGTLNPTNEQLRAIRREKKEKIDLTVLFVALALIAFLVEVIRREAWSRRARVRPVSAQKG